MSAKILVVDDEPEIIGMIKLKMRNQIKENKYRFVFAKSAYEALSILENEHENIDILVSDINMPGMNGISLVNKVNDKFPSIKSVMVTAYSDMNNIRSAMKNGVHDYLTKPLNFADFETTLDKTIAYAIKEKNIQETKIKLQKELEDANKKLSAAVNKEKEINRLKSNFVSMISREYREPLTAIQSSSDVLKTIMNGSATEQHKKFLNQIELSVKSMSDLIDEAAYFEEIENDEPGMYTGVYLDCLLETIINEFRVYNTQNNEILFLPHKKNININGEEKYIYLVINNILSNASKFSPKGSKIEISTVDLNDHILVIISDEGIGIPKNEIDKVTEPFQKCSNAKKISGAGLGMSITKRAINKLNGELRIKSALNKGTKVYVKFRK